MPLIFLCGFVAIALWSLVEHRFERYGVAGPAALTLAGAVLVFIDVDGFAEAAAGDAAEHVVELILAVLLFVDACEVRGGVFGGEGRAVARLVLMALPLSLLAVVLSGVWILPQLNVFVLLVIACVVMPTDFSPAATLLRSPWIPPPSAPRRCRRSRPTASSRRSSPASCTASCAPAARWSTRSRTPR
ncbi:hypothetical protein [Microbacterium lacticum]